MPKRKRRVYTSPKPEVMPDPVEFELDGIVYTCRELGPLEISEIARMQGLPTTDPRSMAFMAELFETLLGVAQYKTFRFNAGQFETRPEVFVDIIQGIFEDLTTRNPTVPSDSSDGLDTGEMNSMDDSYSRALAQLEGRPDLQMAVLRSQEARQS